MAFYGEKPKESCFYAKNPTGRMEIIAWSPPPSEGHYGTVGCSRAEFVRRIPNGDYDSILHGSGATCP